MHYHQMFRYRSINSWVARRLANCGWPYTSKEVDLRGQEVTITDDKGRREEGSRSHQPGTK